MRRKLLLHLGAHKTATSHFQKVLETNCHLLSEGYYYEPVEVVRKHLRWNANEELLADSVEYLKRLAVKEINTLIISEENILGETRDIFKYREMYEGATKRLQCMYFFFQQFDEVEVWLGVRSLDEFIPSIYTEYLRHFRYRKFSMVYEGYLEQSWLQVVIPLIELFPKSQITVLRYEHYQQNLPVVLSSIMSAKGNPDLLLEQKIRPSISYRVIRLYQFIFWLFPRRKQSKILGALVNVLGSQFSDEKYNPFTKNKKEILETMYQDDLIQIRKLENVRIL